MNPRLYFLALGTFALGTDLLVIAGVLPAVAHDRDVSIETASWLVTVFSLVYAFGAPFLAAFTGHFSRRALLLIVLLGFTLANLLSAFAPNFQLLLLSRVLAAIFASLYTPTATAVAIAITQPERRGQALAIVIGGLSSATVIGVPLGTWLGQHFGWPTTFLFVAGLAGLAFLVLLAFGLKDVPAPPSISLRTRLAPLMQPNLLLALSPLALWTSGVFVTYTYIAPFLLHSARIADPSVMLLFYGAGSIVGSVLGGYLVDRIGSTRLIMIPLALLAVLLATLSLSATTLPGAACALALWGVAGWMVFAPNQHRLISLAPHIPTVMLALNSSALYIGIAGGSALGSVVLARNSLTVLPPVSAVFLLISLAVFLWSLYVSAKQTQKIALPAVERDQIQSDTLPSVPGRAHVGRHSWLKGSTEEARKTCEAQNRKN